MTPEEIKQAREIIGLDMKRMAQVIDASYSGYTKWERGERQPDKVAQKAIKMAVFLHQRGLLEEFNDLP